MNEVTPEQILSIPPTATPPTQPKKSATWWTIFWLLGFTPVGWYFIWRKTSWPSWVKLVVTVVTVLLFVGLIIETELLTVQLSSQLTNTF